MIGEFLKLFCFDAQLKNEMQMLMYPKISVKAKEYLYEDLNCGTTIS